MPGQRPTITEEDHPPYLAYRIRQAIAKRSTAGNYQPGELAPLTDSVPLSLTEQLKRGDV